MRQLKPIYTYIIVLLLSFNLSMYEMAYKIVMLHDIDYNVAYVFFNTCICFFLSILGIVITKKYGLWCFIKPVMYIANLLSVLFMTYGYCVYEGYCSQCIELSYRIHNICTTILVCSIPVYAYKTSKNKKESIVYYLMMIVIGHYLSNIVLLSVAYRFLSIYIIFANCITIFIIVIFNYLHCLEVCTKAQINSIKSNQKIFSHLQIFICLILSLGAYFAMYDLTNNLYKILSPNTLFSQKTIFLENTIEIVLSIMFLLIHAKQQKPIAQNLLKKIIWTSISFTILIFYITGSHILYIYCVKAWFLFLRFEVQVFLIVLLVEYSKTLDYSNILIVALSVGKQLFSNSFIALNVIKSNEYVQILVDIIYFNVLLATSLINIIILFYIINRIPFSTKVLTVIARMQKF